MTSLSAAELFPFLSISSSSSSSSSTSTSSSTPSFSSSSSSLKPLEAKNKQQRQHEPLKEVKFTELVTNDGQGKQVVFRQICAQPEYDTLHPLQIRLQLEYPELYCKQKQTVFALLEQKRQADYAHEQQYRRVLFGVST
jgi:hypothetical protein